MQRLSAVWVLCRPHVKGAGSRQQASLCFHNSFKDRRQKNFFLASENKCRTVIITEADYLETMMRVCI